MSKENVKVNVSRWRDYRSLLQAGQCLVRVLRINKMPTCKIRRKPAGSSKNPKGKGLEGTQKFRET